MKGKFLSGEAEAKGLNFEVEEHRRQMSQEEKKMRHPLASHAEGKNSSPEILNHNPIPSPLCTL